MQNNTWYPDFIFWNADAPMFLLSQTPEEVWQGISDDGCKFLLPDWITGVTK